MKNIKLYIYPNAPKQDGLCQEFSNVLPFSEKGIEKHCELVVPDQADIFYCGQLTDREPNKLQPEHFKYLSPETARRHVMDVDGDWPGMRMPEWLKGITITGRNILKDYVGWSVYPTPGASMLTFDLLKNERLFKKPKWHGFYFRGRMDWQFNIRPKVFRALQMANVPHQFSINQSSYMFPADCGLGPYTQEGLNENMQRFEDEMNLWSFSLCPRAGSHYTQRYYESCAMGRIPVVFGDNIWLDHPYAPRCEIPWNATEEEMAGMLQALLADFSLEKVIDAGHQARDYFYNHVEPYFQDPTGQFLKWAFQQKIIS